MAETFKFEFVSPERLVLSEEVEQVQVPGAEGDFTMLAHHAPVLTGLRPGLLDVMLPGGRERRYYVRGGFAEVGAGRLTVLAQQAIDVDDLDREQLAKEISNAEEDAADAADEAIRHAAEDVLDRLKAIQRILKLG